MGALNLPLKFQGYAAVFDRVDRGGDIIRKGSFGVGGIVPLLWQHHGRTIGVVKAREDATGLLVSGEIEDAALADLVRGRAVSGLSVGYRVRASRQGVRRELTQVDLIEVSLVAQPMQPLARIFSIQEGDEE